MRRRVFVAAVGALCPGLAATLAATARQPALVDPGTDARPDGCGRDYIEQTQRNIPTWVYVGDRNARRPHRRRWRGGSRASSTPVTSPTSPCIRRPRTCRPSTAATTST